MMKDYFAEFRRHTQNPGNTGNRVTSRENSAEINDFRATGSVTHDSEGRVTRVTNESSPAAAEPPVTHVTQASEKRVTDASSQKPAQNHAQSESVTRVTRVTHENNDSPAARTRTQTGAPDSRSPLIPPEVRAKLEAIEAEARAKGWPAELLWSSEFWGLPRGLAAVLDPEDEIVEVSAECITIRKYRRDIQRFRRHIA